jgi:DNA-binding NarL/FixJ family response regulator
MEEGNAHPSDRQAIHILLVDDHPVLRAGIRALLLHEPDFDVIGEAGDGRTAVEMASALHPHVVVMDVSIPKLGGAEATKQMVGNTPAPKVLALSAHEEPALARMMLDAGASGYTLKRSAVGELVRAVRLVAAGGSYVDPAIAGHLAPRRGRAQSDTFPTASLSEREVEVIRLVANGYTSKEVASSLGLSHRTLETYKARAMAKLNLRNRADLIRYAMRSGWLREA